MLLTVLTVLLLLFLIFVALRCIQLMRADQRVRSTKKHDDGGVGWVGGSGGSTRNKPARTLVCLGSGGHTTEMLLVVDSLDSKLYSPIVYVVADTDETSQAKLRQNDGRDAKVFFIPRSRRVNQSYATSVCTTLWSTVCTVYLMLFKIGRVDLILTNGPGTCLPVCAVGFLCKLLCVNRTLTIVFVESICRVQTLSFTGRLLLRLVDVFVVQSIQLHRKYPRTVYFGRLF